MKALFLLLAGLVVGGAAEAARPVPNFSPRFERRVLEAVQEACNNTWCEGDFGYEFKKFHCEHKVCLLEMDILTYTKYDANGRPDLASAEHHPATCSYSPVRYTSDVINLDRNYVASKYFVALATCIDENVTKLSDGPKPADPAPPPPTDPVEPPAPPMPLPVEAGQKPAEPQNPFGAFNALFPAPQN